MAKQYQIGGKLFELRPLTHRQRALASPVEQKLRALIFKVATQDARGTLPDQLQSTLDITVQLDELQFSEEFLKFLATILVPADVPKWTVDCIDQNWELMWEMDEETQAQVLRDFFSRQMNSPLGSSVSISASTSGQKPSGTSDGPKESATPTT